MTGVSGLILTPISPGTQQKQSNRYWAAARPVQWWANAARPTQQNFNNTDHLNPKYISLFHLLDFWAILVNAKLLLYMLLFTFWKILASRSSRIWLYRRQTSWNKDDLFILNEQLTTFLSRNRNCESDNALVVGGGWGDEEEGGTCTFLLTARLINSICSLPNCKKACWCFVFKSI